MLLLSGFGNGIKKLDDMFSTGETVEEEVKEGSPPTEEKLRNLRLLDFSSDDLRNHVSEQNLLHEDARYFEKMESYFNYLGLSEDSKHDPITSLYAVRNNSYNFLHVPDEVKTSDFIAACLFNNRKSFLYMSDEEKCKKGVLAYISVADEELFSHFPSYLKDSEKFWSTVVSINPKFIEKLSPEMIVRINKFRHKDDVAVQANTQSQALQQQLAFEMKKKKG